MKKGWVMPADHSVFLTVPPFALVLSCPRFFLMVFPQLMHESECFLAVCLIALSFKWHADTCVALRISKKGESIYLFSL